MRDNKSEIFQCTAKSLGLLIDELNWAYQLAVITISSSYLPAPRLGFYFIKIFNRYSFAIVKKKSEMTI